MGAAISVVQFTSLNSADSQNPEIFRPKGAGLGETPHKAVRFPT